MRKLSFKRKRFLIKLRPDLNVSPWITLTGINPISVWCLRCVFTCPPRVHIRTLWSFWWAAETAVKSSGRSVSSTTPSSASLRNLSPNPNPCSSHEAPPSDSGQREFVSWSCSPSIRTAASPRPLTVRPGSPRIAHYHLSCTCLCSGRTQKQVMDYVKESEFKKIPFER